jgi:CubicO group peptidase (beta-lactamase class C family)
MIIRYSLIFCIGLLLSSCYAMRAYKFRRLELNDNARMPSVPIQKGDSVWQFTEGASLPAYEALKQELDTQLIDTYTAAFLVIRNDSVIYENYFGGFNRQSVLPSFSVSKSFTSVLIGIAIDEGKIASTNDPITKYIPELARRDERFNNITLQHLLDMRSGILWNEGRYNLKDDAIKMGFSPNIMRRVKKLSIEKPPGDKKYKSIDTQLLGIALERATGKKVSVYLQEKMWQPMGMESAGMWTVDSRRHKQEVVFGGMNASARDYAKLGRLMINKGSWNGRSIVSEGWVQASVSPDNLSRYDGYHNQWWAVRNNEAFQAQGILGQIVYINPAKKVVIVRLGHYWKSPRYRYVQRFISSLGNAL